MLNTHTEGTVLVRQGDTLFSLAHSLSVNSDELQRLNSIRYPEAISPGELLRVPSRRPKLRPEYVVKSGDTVWSLCNEHGIDAQELRDLNSLDGITLYEGQNLRLPSPAAFGTSEQEVVSQSTNQLVNAPSAQQSEAQQVGKPPLLRSGDKALVIQDGDTLWDISKELKLDVGSLVDANGGELRDELPLWLVPKDLQCCFARYLHSLHLRIEGTHAEAAYFTVIGVSFSVFGYC
ncbi:hypothetical protein CYMTET_56322 [Cymbomonas tetramitiformis]|uniref:LysM domain-containing protein n=1 Tax=Cymbomonas tetramitiformis TaxID=36881 RepID=A0AAE0EM27_9CHLO|nr:hypothetical protein CYMTET_56322 [Cymbomonas tetramitiformis]